MNPPFTDAPIRILFVAPRYHTNQVESVRALQRAGFQVNYLVQYIGPTEDHSELIPVVAPLNSLGRLLVARESKRTDWMEAMRKRAIPHLRWTWRFLQKLRPDVVVVRGPTQFMGLVCTLLSRLSGAKVVFYTQQNQPASTIKELLYQVLLDIFRAVWITPIRSDNGALHPSVHRIRYVPFVAPSANCCANLQTPKVVKVLSVGKFVARKNHILLIKALEPWLKAGQAHLTLVGEASDDNKRAILNTVKQTIADLQLDEHVTIRPNVPFAAMSAVYAASDLFVLPSRDEPAAVSILEAMAHGLPAICSTTNGTQCYIESGLNGFVFESDSMLSLRAALEQTLDNPGKLEQMKIGTKEVIRRNHSPQAYIARIQDLLKLLGVNPPNQQH